MLAEPAVQIRRIVGFQNDRVVASHALRRQDPNRRLYSRAIATGTRDQKVTKQQRREINAGDFGLLNFFGTDVVFELIEPRITNFGQRRLSRRRDQEAEVGSVSIKRGATNEMLCARFFVPDNDGGFLRDPDELAPPRRRRASLPKLGSEQCAQRQRNDHSSRKMTCISNHKSSPPTLSFRF